ITIEASINTSTLLVQRDIGPADNQPLVVQSTVPPPRAAPPPPVRTSHTFGAEDAAAAALRKYLQPTGPMGPVVQDHLDQVKAFLNDPAQNFGPVPPQVPTFLSGTQFAAKRQELARKLGLIR